LLLLEVVTEINDLVEASCRGKLSSTSPLKPRQAIEDSNEEKKG